MKVMLIFPDQSRSASPAHMQKVQRGLGILPPLGLLSIAGFLRVNSSHDVLVIDMPALNIDLIGLEKLLNEQNPDVIGIYTITFNLRSVLNIARQAKRLLPSVRTVMGGPHVSHFALESTAFPEIDYVVSGEGEYPFLKLLEYLENRETDLSGLPVFGGNLPADFAISPYVHEDLDKIPCPPRNLTPWQRYRTVVSLHPPTTVVMSSRGCPHRCIFCNTAGGKRVRFRSADSIMDEIDHCMALGIREFFFFDETFTHSGERVKEICHRILENRLEIFWDVRGRADQVDRKTLQLMKRAGCRRIQYGIESGTAEVLKTLRKGFTPEVAEKAVRITREVGIIVYADFMIGNPGETREMALKTLDFAMSLGLDYAHFSITMPLPGTELYNGALERGVIKEDYWREFAKNPERELIIRYWEENMSRVELEELLESAYRRFYFRPGQILKTLSRIRSPGELLRKMKAGLRLMEK